MRTPTCWLVGLFGLAWLLAFGCRTGDLIAQADPWSIATAAPTRTVRPTFTSAPPTVPPVPTPSPLVVQLPVVKAPTAPPAPTRPRAPVAPPTPVPSPTADYQGYYYRVLKNVCVSAGNTRAEGTVYNNGQPQNGVKVRIANGNGGDPIIDDFVTGVDPSDYKHQDPALEGKYRLGIAEGQQIDGNWWVFLINDKGEQISVGAYFKTHDGPGCNTAFIDFAH